MAVIGAGFAGLGAAIQLFRSGERSFLVFERAHEVGGTWRDNVYPGVACDIPSHLYSFSFAPKTDWNRKFAGGSEILEYLRACAAEEGVQQRIRLGCSLHEARWDGDAALWRLRTSKGSVTASVLVIATGRFSEPKIPRLAGLESFTGPICHTARWRPDVARPGAHVGIVGTGASAAQLVPQLVASGVKPVVFQRSPAWVIPKSDTLYDRADRDRYRKNEAARLRHRRALFGELEQGFGARVSGSEQNAELRRTALAHLQAQVSDPALRLQLTPDYPIGSKRVVLSDDWYPALSSPQTTLEASALERIEPSEAAGGVAIAASGSRYPVDSLVFATGFEAARPAIARVVVGQGGRSLSQHWRQGMTSYGSTAVHGFPNCFLLGGPNSALGHNSAVAMIETQVAHLVDALRHIPEGTACEVSAAAERAYTQLIADMTATTVWASDTHTSWYRDPESGRITLLWPGTATTYAARHGRFDAAQYLFTQTTAEVAA